MAADLYATLGLKRSASDAEIRAAYRKLAKALHPDLNPDDAGREERFKAVSAAFAILGDAEQRGKYDRGEIDENGDPINTFRGGGGGFGGGFGAGGSDPFEELFGGGLGGRRGRRRTGPIKGRDLRYQVKVSFEDAVLGARRRMTMADGKTLEVDIPAGIEDGQTLRLRSQGQPSPTGGPPGDALLAVNITPSSVWTRQGFDLHMRQPISLELAVLGGKIDVKTPGGPVSMRIPAGSNTGTMLRLKGKGVARAGQPGALLVRLEIMLEDPKSAPLTAFLKEQNRQ